MSSLASIISGLSPDPWGLSDFTAYLSRNHCLENLQFVQDASRYRVCYSEIVGGNRIPRASLRCHYDYLQALWEGLLGTYIRTNGHREVNLPSEVSDRLLGFRSSDFLPHPSELDDAVEIVHQLMEDSILPGFLNSHMSLEKPGDRGRVNGGELAAEIGERSQRRAQNWTTGESCKLAGPPDCGLPVCEGTEGMEDMEGTPFMHAATQ